MSKVGQTEWTNTPTTENDGLSAFGRMSMVPTTKKRSNRAVIG